MTMATSLLPVAASALTGLLQGLGDIGRGSAQFAQLLRGSEQPEPEPAAHDADAAQPLLPNNTKLALQVQRDALRQRFETLQTQVHRSLTTCFDRCGISLSEPAVLSRDAEGRWLETSGHWNRGAIEEALVANRELRDQLQQLLETGQRFRQLQSPSPAVPAENTRLVVTPEAILFQVT